MEKELKRSIKDLNLMGYFKRGKTWYKEAKIVSYDYDEKGWRIGNYVSSIETMFFIISKEEVIEKKLEEEWKKLVVPYVEKYKAEKRKNRKEIKEWREKLHSERIEKLENSFSEWKKNYEGKQLSSKRRSELYDFEDKFNEFNIPWTYVHEILKRDFTISFSSSEEDEVQEKLEKIFQELNLEDDGESEELSNQYTSIKLDLYEDGFDIQGSTNDPEIGSMKANRLNICWLS